MHPCNQYALEVVEGRRVVGMPEFLACQRHLDDLKRQGAEDFPYIFDEKQANKIYKWFTFCVHVKGIKAGQPIELEPFQEFDLGCIFGWVHQDTGLRRFEKAYEQMGRKNGKSTIVSGIALYLMAGDKEEAPDVFPAATDKQQARIIYQDAMVMAQKSPEIRKRLRIRQYEISHKTRGGQMRPLSRDTKNKDGLNPHGALIDEYHAHPTSEIYDLLWSAWGQRSQALMMIITTAGLQVENSPCYKEYLYCKQILQGIVANDRYFVMIRELDEKDDIHDPANWIKANPLRAASEEGIEKIKAQHDEAFGSGDPAKVRTFRVKILNIWVEDLPQGYIGDHIKTWKELAVSREAFLELTKDRKCIVGLDLSKKIDLTGEGFIFPLDDGRIAVCAQGFIPMAAVERHEKTDQVPYRDWARDGWVTVTQGEVTDYGFVETFTYDTELENGWNIHEIVFDPYNATHLANNFIADGYVCIEARQGVKTLSEPTKLFREMIAQRKVVHDGSPALTWCLSNAVTEIDSNENIKLSKKNASDTRRIDLLAALMNAMVRVQALQNNMIDLSDAILDDEWGM